MGEPDGCTTLYTILSEIRSLPRREYQFRFQPHSPSCGPLRACSLWIRRPLDVHVLCLENKSRSNRFFHPSEICNFVFSVFVSAQSAAHPLTHSTVRYASHEQANTLWNVYYIILLLCYIKLGTYVYYFVPLPVIAAPPQKPIKINNVQSHWAYIIYM